MSAQPSKRELALLDITNRLSFIQIAKGYNTDAGASVFIYEDPQLGPDDALGIFVEPGPDQPTMAGPRITAQLPIQIQAVVNAQVFATVAARISALEGLIADIKRAVEIDEGDQANLQHSLDGTLPKGLIRSVTVPLRREPGSQLFGAAVEYTAVFQEQWGEP